MPENNPRPLVTILCLAHNHLAYIRDAMDGFLMQQTTFPIEIIMHDDCSTDGTADVIREYEARHSDCLHGIYQHRNRYAESISEWNDFLFSKVKGKYIAFSDGDDFWTDPLKLQKQIEILESDDTLVACITGCAIVNQTGQPTHECMQVVPDNRPGRYSIREFIYQRHNWPVTTVVFRNRNMEAVFSRAKRMENPWLGDWTMWVALLCDGDSYFLDDVTAAYRINPTSQTHTNVDERRMGQARLNFRLTPIVADLMPEGYEDVRQYLLTHHADNWWKLANAYKHQHQYVHTALCLLRWAWRKAIEK